MLPARTCVSVRFIRVGDRPDKVHLAAVDEELIERDGMMAG